MRGRSEAERRRIASILEMKVIMMGSLFGDDDGVELEDKVDDGPRLKDKICDGRSKVRTRQEDWKR